MATKKNATRKTGEQIHNEKARRYARSKRVELAGEAEVGGITTEDIRRAILEMDRDEAARGVRRYRVHPDYLKAAKEYDGWTETLAVILMGSAVFGAMGVLMFGLYMAGIIGQ